MKHKQINIFITFLLISILLVGCSPSKDEKINNIIEQLKLVETQRFVFEYQIEALKYQSSGKDSVRVCQLETQLSEENVKIKIAATIKEKLSSKEINDIYSFINSNVFNEFFMSGGLHQIASSEFDDVSKELENLYQLQPQMTPKPKNDFIPIPIDRADGFYETLNYSMSTKDDEIEVAEIPVLTPKDIIKATKSTERLDGIIEISIIFTKEGARKFQQITRDNIGKPLPIVINKRIISMPTVNCEIMGGRASISGNFTENEANEIIKKLKKE